MTYISSSSVLSSVRQSVLQAQAGLAQAQTEISSGAQADLGVYLGAKAGTSVSLKNQIDALDGFTSSNAVASTRLDTTATALTAMISAAQAMSASLVTASSTGGSTDGLQASGTAGLQALLSGLNTSVGGQYVFGGIASGTAPATNYATTSKAKAAVDASFDQAFGFSQTSADASNISGSDMTTFLNGSFDSQFSADNWSSNWSQASSTAISGKISPSQSATTSVSANETAFRQIAEAYTMLGEFTGSNMSADAKAAVVAKATALVNTGLAALNQVQTGVGVTQAAITSADTRTSAQATVLKEQVSDMESVDTYALSTRVTTLQTQLQASYELTSRLQSLSLTNYLNGVSQRMYQARYDEVLEDDQTAARRVEYQALDRCVFLLGKAEKAGVQSRECVDALHWTVQIWQTFLVELADDANVLPNELRAKLISVGIWILKQSDAIRLGRSTDFAAISGICAIVRDGCAEGERMHINLRSGEKLYLNGAVLRADRKVSLELMNDAAFLLEAHVMSPDKATTPLRQLYFVVQMMLMNPQDAVQARRLFATSLEAMTAAYDDAGVQDALAACARQVANDRLFDALKGLRCAFALDDALLGPTSGRVEVSFAKGGLTRLWGGRGFRARLRKRHHASDLHDGGRHHQHRRRQSLVHHDLVELDRLGDDGRLQQLPEAARRRAAEPGSDEPGRSDPVHEPTRLVLGGRTDGSDQHQARHAADLQRADAGRGHDRAQGDVRRRRDQRHRQVGGDRHRRHRHGHARHGQDGGHGQRRHGRLVNEADALEIVQHAVWTVMAAAGPAVAVAMAVGLVVALFQALTQIQEMTLTFVPKIVAVLLVTALTASFIGAQIFTFTSEVYARIEKGF